MINNTLKLFNCQSQEEESFFMEAFNVSPNPFRNTSLIEVDLLQSSNVHLTVYDLKGQKIADLFEGQLNRGKHNFEINDQTLQESGVYICRLESRGEVVTRKIVRF